MCPGIAVLAGGGDGGGGSGKGSKRGKGKKKGKTSKKKKDASGKKKKGGKGCGDPVCPVTGRMFLDFLDFAFPGPMTFSLVRSYSSRSVRDGDFGVGWSHEFSWQVHESARRTIVIDEAGLEQFFEKVPTNGDPITNDFGWSLRREGAGFRLFEGEDVTRWFGPAINGVHYLIAITDVWGNKIEFIRDQRGVLSGIVDSAGRRYRVDTDRAGHIIAISAATHPTNGSFEELARYTYDADGRLTSFTDAEGFFWAYRYLNFLMVEHQVPTGLSYHYRYDGTGPDAYCIESWGSYRDRADPALAEPLPGPGPSVSDPPILGINYVRFTYLKDDYYSEMLDGRGGITRHFGDDSGRAGTEPAVEDEGW